MISKCLINIAFAVVLLAAIMLKIWQTYMYFKEAHQDIVGLIIISLFLRYSTIYQIYFKPMKYNQGSRIAENRSGLGPYLVNTLY